MIEASANASTYRVGETLRGAQVAKQSGRETSTESFIEYLDGVEVRIIFRRARANHVDRTLIHIGFRDQVVARLRGIGRKVLFGKRRTLGPIREGLLQFRFHGSRIEIAYDPEDDVVGMHIGVVPLDQVLLGDGGDGRVLRIAAVGIVGPVGEPRDLAPDDAVDVIVAPRNRVECIALGKLEFIGAKRRILQQVHEDFEDIVKVALQARPADGGGINAAASFDFGGAGFEVVVELIAGLRFRSACAPDFSVHVGQADFASRFEPGTTANAGDAINQRQLMIFLQEDDHAVGKNHTFGFRSMEIR